MGGATIPLHIADGDYSPEACQRRLFLYEAMKLLNPKGFRKPRASRLGARSAPSYRIDSIAMVAALADKAGITKMLEDMAVQK